MLLDRLAFFSLPFVYFFPLLPGFMAVCHLNIACLCESCLFLFVQRGMFAHKQNKQTQHACTMFYFCSQLLTVCRCEWECTLLCCFGRCVKPLDCIWTHLIETAHLIPANNTFRHTHTKQINKPCSKGACNWRALGESAQRGPDARPETRETDQHPSAC